MTKEWENRIDVWMGVLKKHIYTPMQEISFKYYKTMEHLKYEEAMGGDFQPIAPGDAWGKEWEYGWFTTSVHLGEWAKGKRVVMDLDLGGESTVFVNGKVFGTTRAAWSWYQNPLHYLCDNYLTKEGTGDDDIVLTMECYAGHSLPPENGEAASGPISEFFRWERPTAERAIVGRSTCGIWNEEAYHLMLELEILLDIEKYADGNSLRVTEVEEALREFTLKIDFSQSGEEFLESVKVCRKLIQPYLKCTNGSTVPHMHAIGHAHINLAWFWPFEETERKGARTMAAQIRHMDEYPEYKMILSQPQLYEMIREYYPELFQRLKEKAASGQLIPEGGMWVESDTNIPSGESLVRQFLYGKKYFKEEFGIDSKMLWLPDVFGYSGALPQIMAGCGIKYFATAKIFWTYHGGDPFPYHYFNWKGIDGTKTESFIHVEYSSRTDAEALIKKWNGRRKTEPIKRMLVAVGYGDGGGGCTRDHIENVRLLGNCEGVPAISFDHPNHFFELMYQETKQIPEYVGELYFQAHRGTYTSQAYVKKNNRRCELALREAELWSTIADMNQLAVYPAAEFEANWKILLKNQFHDILPGSSIHKVYQTFKEETDGVLDFAGNQSQRMIGVLGQSEGEGNWADTMTVFNSLSWEREVLVKLPEGWHHVKNSKDEYLPVQKMLDGVYTLVKIPSMGSITIHLSVDMERAQNNAEPPTLFVSGNSMENEWMCITFNEYGEIISLLDKETGREWAAGILNEMKLYQDVPAKYEAWDIDSIRKEVYTNEMESADITIVEQGKLYVEIKVERTLHKSKMTQWIGLKKDAKTITFRTKIDWQEKQKLLKVGFSVNVTTDELISEIQYGYVKRSNHKSRQYDRDRFEVCNHKWSALTESGRGCAILNDSKYGISCEGSHMELTLLKSATFPDESADIGIQEFTYAFSIWNTPLIASEVVKQAYELNVAPQTAAGVGRDISYLGIDSKTVIIDCVKKAEQRENAIVLRLYESMGSRENTKLYLNFPVKECMVSNMIEECKDGARTLQIDDGIVELEFGAFEVKTLILIY